MSIESVDIKNSKRKDNNTKALLKLIKEEELNKEIKWMSFKVFLKYLNIVIKKEKNNMKELEINKQIYNYTNILNNNNYLEDNDANREDKKITGYNSILSSDKKKKISMKKKIR